MRQAVASTYPGPVWVHGEISGLRRTSRGAIYFRLVDSDSNRHSLTVGARGRIAMQMDRRLEEASVGRLRDGIQVRISGIVEVDGDRSGIRLSLLDVDPAFTAGRMATDRAEVLRRLSADGTLGRNAGRPIPLVPLRVGLVTSRGSAAHADFCNHLRASNHRFRVTTVHASTQGDHAESTIVAGLALLSTQPVDVIVLTRGGGSKLDLAAFDRERVARAIADAPVPVITGIGHDIDRTVADEAASISVKTPTAAAEWLTAAVGEFSDRVARARTHITDQAHAALDRARQRLDTAASVTGIARGALAGHEQRLSHLQAAIADSARRSIHDQHATLEGISNLLDAIGVDATLQRGFAVVTDEAGRVIRSARVVRGGQTLRVRLADGTFTVEVSTSNDRQQDGHDL